MRRSVFDPSSISQCLILKWEQGKEWRATRQLGAVQRAYPYILNKMDVACKIN